MQNPAADLATEGARHLCPTGQWNISSPPDALIWDPAPSSGMGGIQMWQKSMLALSLESNDNMFTAASPLRLKVRLYFASKLHPFNSGEEHHSAKMREGDNLKQGAHCAPTAADE